MVRRLIAAAAACVLAGGVPAAAGQIQTQRKELGRIQKEIEQTRQELEELRRQETLLSREAKKLESRDGETRRRISEIQRGIRSAENRRGELRGRVGSLRLASEFWTSVLLSELREHSGRLAVREAAWSEGLWGESFMRAALMEKARIVAGLKGTRLRTEAAAEAARRKAAALKDRGRQAQAEEEKVRAEYQLKQAAVNEAREKVAAAEKKAKELEETKAALAKLLSRIGAEASRQGAPPARLELPRNSLPWPVQGTVSRPFGRERNQELKTWVFHQGVTFSAQAGSAVSAVGSGQVIYSGPFRSYGRVVIVDHGGGFFSVYGELGQISKSKGSAVSEGETLGTTGGQGTSGTAYLELRRGTEALDPMLWLRKKD
jgi:septal ring factor EnvC (AmiA/AmiB activator)